MSDAIAVMSEGKVEQYGTPEEIYGAPETEFAAKFVGLSNWIDNTHMFRPEKASLNPKDGAIVFNAEVTSVQFLGRAYQLRLAYGGQRWSIPSSDKMSVGTKVAI